MQLMYAYIHMYVCRFSGYIFHNIMEYFEKGYHNLCEASNRTSIPLALFWLATCRPSESGRIFFLSQWILFGKSIAWENLVLNCNWKMIWKCQTYFRLSKRNLISKNVYNRFINSVTLSMRVATKDYSQRVFSH